MDKTCPHSAPLGRQPLPTYTPSLSQQLGAPESESPRGGRGWGWPLGRGQVPAVTRGFAAQPQFLKGPGKKTVEVKSKQPLVGRVGGH